MKKLLITAVLLFLISFVFAEQRFTFEVENADKVLRQNAARLPKLMNPGEPLLPYYPVKILLPMGMEIKKFNLEFSKTKNMINSYLEPAGLQVPISSGKSGYAPKSKIYESDKEFPQEKIIYIGTQFKNGLAIALFNVFPYVYNPAKNIISWSDRFSVVLEYEENADLFEKENIGLLKDFSRKIKLPGADKTNLETYEKTFSRQNSRIPDENDPYKFIIVTGEDFAPLFDDFIERKEAEGIHTGITFTEEIFAEYDGNDDAEKLRNYIIDAYQTYASTSEPLEYVLLGGDDEVVPYRGCYGYVGDTVDSNIPTDYYFSNLDGNWNANGNDIYGEEDDDVDFYPEIAVGRLPGDSEIDFENFFAKNLYYAESNTYSNKIAYMLGENLNNNPVTWGGDYKDEVKPYVPNDFIVKERYMRDNNYSAQKVAEAFDDGFAVGNHMGHANTHFVFGLTNGTVNALKNSEFGFIYSQGCYPGAFDEGESGPGESVAERLVISEHGLYAFTGNTRYGWYSPGNTNGASQFYDIEYFKALFEENIREHGKALVYSKEQLINEAAFSSVMRWVYYELTLFGDPTSSVKTPSGQYCKLDLADYEFDDSSGDNDGVINPGESGILTVSLRNGEEWDDCSSAQVVLTSENTNINIFNNVINFGAINSGQTVESSESFSFEIDADAEIEPFVFKLSVHGEADGSVFNRDYEVSFITSLNQNTWPWSDNQKVFRSSPLALYNIEEDYREILDLSQDGDIYKFRNNSSFFSVMEEDETITKTHLAMGHINDDDLMDYAYNTMDGKIIAKDNSGEIIFAKSGLAEQRVTAVLANIGGDDKQEIISSGIDGDLHVFDSSGEELPGFPVNLGNLVFPELAAADFDNDGYFEILAPLFNGELKMIDNDGTIVSSFDFSTESYYVSAPVIDGNKNIYIADNNNKLFQTDKDGNKNWEYQLSSPSSNEIALEQDGDYYAYVTTRGGEIYYFKDDGELQLGYPVSVSENLPFGPLLADLDDNGETEIITLTNFSNIYIFTKNGNQTGYSPVMQNLSGYCGATVADMDWDGDYEIISAHYHGIAVTDIKTDKGNLIPWIMYRGNYMRNGFYGDNPVADKDEDIALPNVLTLSQNYPNPFADGETRNGTTINFFLPKDENISLSVYNTKGQKVKTLIGNEKFAKGKHTVTWNGSNSSGKKVGSGVYFYKLQTKSESVNRKMIFIK
ncbi:MAG: hypothetical protein CSB55_08795 [Candidatus Cloacimonadota bacterium]|nr:MAG: hypothetical protein CSB55_08795 [Candidatus Cloacimonadota bacterium]